jgi:hypothetical protein
MPLALEPSGSLIATDLWALVLVMADVWMRRVGGLAFVAAVLASLGGCGGGENGVTTPATPAPTPTPGPVRSVVSHGNFTISAPDRNYTYFRRLIINTTATGTLDTTVDWTYPTNTLWMYMAEGECTADQFASDDCPGPACACKFSVESEVAAPKPRVLSVPNASQGQRTLVVWNLGPSDEACSYQAVLTTTVATLLGAARATVEPELVSKRIPPRLSEDK